MIVEFKSTYQEFLETIKAQRQQINVLAEAGVKVEEPVMGIPPRMAEEIIAEEGYIPDIIFGFKTKVLTEEQLAMFQSNP